jgi:hypothetical protein
MTKITINRELQSLSQSLELLKLLNHLRFEQQNGVCNEKI